MKSNFLSGLIVLLPIFITFIVIKFLITALTAPFLTLTEAPELTILLFLFFFTILTGYLAEKFLLHQLIKGFDRVMHKIPFLSKIYKPVQDMLHTFFVGETSIFSKPVIVPFMNAHSFAFIISDRIILDGKEYFSVYVPGAPNPIMGFLFLLPKKQIIPVSLSSEKIIRQIVSCGIIKHT